MPRRQRRGAALAGRGYAIALHYNRSADEARQSVRQFEKQGVRAAAFGADLAHDAEVTRLFDQVQQTFGRLDVLVTAAAVWQRKPLEEVTADDVAASSRSTRSARSSVAGGRA